ncbi:hypothetical protein ABZS66_36315 [Dactylosporangium sp. NPDC005572]|uniref:hypothetical protein n=1 Tax=Dactylosporangium sp. NPDC005572 TaxID=3156889 RepID=UPI00339FA0D4
MLRSFQMEPGWDTKLQRELDKKLEELAEQIANQARANLAAHTITGDLLKSVRAEGPDTFIGTDHWRHFEYGTQRHTIKAKPKKALKFNGTYAKKVNHPGNREYAPMRKALDAVFVSINAGVADGFVSGGDGFISGG